MSYSRSDEQVVKALAQGLMAAKRAVWFDHDLGGGDAWWDSILENIRSATVFLFALSDASAQRSGFRCRAAKHAVPWQALPSCSPWGK